MVLVNIEVRGGYNPFYNAQLIANLLDNGSLPRRAALCLESNVMILFPVSRLEIQGASREFSHDR